MLSTEENLVKSLTCDNFDFSFPETTPMVSSLEKTLVPNLLVQESASPHPVLLLALEYAPRCTPWLLSGMLLMSLNSYFLQLLPVLSFWTPF
ncbi:hypothetical protein DSO57_1025208 [Entomophthora muscae]|uniref:Uncharacterized protein n=1 Tax=Entomophthora muscae TaxID=34485 RepID=A0ACC2S4E9_9FUNG|nr:hypothetical protein DSO57_1025208 [Entomophthora muscae]